MVIHLCSHSEKERKKEGERKKQRKREARKEGKKEREAFMAWWCILRSHLHWPYNVNTISGSSWMMNLSLPWGWKAIAIAKLWTVPREKTVPLLFSVGCCMSGDCWLYEDFRMQLRGSENLATPPLPMHWTQWKFCLEAKSSLSQSKIVHAKIF